MSMVLRPTASGILFALAACVGDQSSEAAQA